MKEYKNIDDFNSHIFNDTIDYIFDTFIFEKIEKEDDLVELLGGQSNRHLDEVLYIAYMHCKNNIATYDKTDKNGNDYYSLNLSDIENETVEDFKELMKYFDVDLCASMMNKSSFDKYIKSIKLK